VFTDFIMQFGAAVLLDPTWDDACGFQVKTRTKSFAPTLSRLITHMESANAEREEVDDDDVLLRDDLQTWASMFLESVLRTLAGESLVGYLKSFLDKYPPM
jgi:hypothetical protein